MNLNFMMAGAISINPVIGTLAIFLVLAWRIGGYLIPHRNTQSSVYARACTFCECLRKIDSVGVSSGHCQLATLFCFPLSGRRQERFVCKKE
jgi:hypothetical protein